MDPLNLLAQVIAPFANATSPTSQFSPPPSSTMVYMEPQQQLATAHSPIQQQAYDHHHTPNQQRVSTNFTIDSIMGQQQQPPPVSEQHSTTNQTDQEDEFVRVDLDESEAALASAPVAATISQEEASQKKTVKKIRPKNFICPDCPMAFSNNGQLKNHIRIHTGERPFDCDECGKTFTRNEELTRHTLIHTGFRPHACSKCPKRFGRKDHLKKHEKTHEKRPPRTRNSAPAALQVGLQPPANNTQGQPILSPAKAPPAPSMPAANSVQQTQVIDATHSMSPPYTGVSLNPIHPHALQYNRYNGDPYSVPPLAGIPMPPHPPPVTFAPTMPPFIDYAMAQTLAAFVASTSSNAHAQLLQQQQQQLAGDYWQYYYNLLAIYQQQQKQQLLQQQEQNDLNEFEYMTPK